MKHLISLLLILLSSIHYATSKPPIYGTVRAADNAQPLRYVEVTIKNTTEKTLTDSAGYFAFENPPMGYHTLLFNSVGYDEDYTEPLLISRAKPQVVNIFLWQSINLAEAVVVTARPIRRAESPPIGLKTLDIEQINKLPGATRDISRAIQNLPGVAATSVDRTDLIVRGGAPSENKFYLDKIEIPVLNHFQTQGSSGGNASIVNSDLISGATLYTSAFPASRANGLSSILELKLKEGNSEGFKTKFSVGSSDLAMTFDTPLGKKSSLIASYRISYLQFLFSALELPFLPTYQDLQFKYLYRPNNNNKLTILGLSSYDYNRLNTTLTDLSVDRQQLLEYLPENDQWSYVIGAVYSHIFSTGTLDVILSHNRLNNKLQKWAANNKDSLQTLNYLSNESEVKARLEYNSRLGNGYVLNCGVGSDLGWYSNRTSQIIYLEAQPFENKYSTSLSLVRYTAFGSLNKRYFDDKFRVMLSLRLEGNNYNSSMSNPLNQFSPRLALEWEFNSKWAVSGNIGRYYQEPSYTTMGYRDSLGTLVNQTRLEYIGSNQATVGFAYKPTRSSKLSFELFYKHYDHYPMSLVDSTPIGSSSTDAFAIGAESAASIGRARAYGVELTYQNEDLWGFFLYTTYTYVNSKYAKLSDGYELTNTYIPTNWDYRHLFNFIVSRDLPKDWEVALKWRFSGGAPSTPYDTELSSKIDVWQTNKQPVLDYSLVNSQRLEPFHQLDIRVDKTWYFNRWTFGLYLDIQNLYNYKIYDKDLLTPLEDFSGNYVVDPSDPSRYILESYANELGGTIIPTFGVVIEF